MQGSDVFFVSSLKKLIKTVEFVMLWEAMMRIWTQYNE